MTQLPSPDTDYAAPLDMALTKASWDAAMVSIGTRLRGLEAVEADFQTVVEQLEGQALAVIQTNIAPILATLREEIIELRAQILLAEDAVSILTQGNVFAESVTFVPNGGIAAGNVQEALVEVAGDVTSVAQSVTDVEASVMASQAVVQGAINQVEAQVQALAARSSGGIASLLMNGAI